MLNAPVYATGEDTMSHIRKLSFLYGLFFVVYLVLGLADRVIAGGMATPIAEQLDMAQSVVLGRVTLLVDKRDIHRSSGLRHASATIAIDKTLKGGSRKSISCLVISRVDRGYMSAKPVREVHVGDHGIWLIWRGELLASGRSLRLLENDEGLVRRTLAMLARRKWSKPVNGLKAWAGVLEPDYPSNVNPSSPIIALAIKNVQQKETYVPWMFGMGSIDAYATCRDGTVLHVLISGSISDGNYCKRLNPGETVYLMPELRGLGFRWNEAFQAGTYWVTLSCSSEETVGYVDTKANLNVKVMSWKGKLNAPTVKVVIP
jgi:hypothetical protein